MDRILEEEVLGYVFYGVVIWILVFWEFMRKWLAPALHFGVFIFVGTGVSAYCGFRVWRLRRDVRKLKQAEKAERHVSDLLRRLRRFEYVTFDDLFDETAGWKSNIDHVVVGPGGVFAIETKGYSIFGNGRAQIGADGALRLSKRETLGNPLADAAFAAKKVARQLQLHLRQEFAVQPVLVLPGWDIAMPKSESGVVVLNDGTVEEFFKSRQRVMSNQQVRDICSHLDRNAREYSRFG